MFPSLPVFTPISPVEYLILNIMSIQIGMKVTPITAIPGILGQEVVTYTSGNFYETKNYVGKDPKTNITDWVVTQKSGEKMIVKDSLFKDLYYQPESYVNSNTYFPKGAKRAVCKVDNDVSFDAPWGETQFLKAGGYLVMVKKDNIYGVQKEEFENSYQIFKEENGTLFAKNLLGI